MVSLLHVLLCATMAVLFWTAFGYPIARMSVPAGWSALAAAPALGWAAFSAASLPVLPIVGFTPAAVAALSAAALAGSALATLSLRKGRPDGPGRPTIPAWVFVLAGLAACAPAVAVMPKHVAEGVILAAPAFDHSKVAIIDEIARLGLPPGNPTFGEAGQPARLAYYYLWHLSAATLALPLGASGWEADIALTWFTAFSSLLLMMGLAVWIGGRAAAAVWVVPLSLVGSSRPALAALLGPEALDRLLSGYGTLGGWLVQATWSPQHLASACCVLLAVVLAVRLAEGGDRRLVPALALAVAAGYGSSTWIGGVAFAVAAVPVGLALLLRLDAGARAPFLLNAAAAAALGLALAFPLLGDQYAATSARGGGTPIGLWPYEVLGSAVPDGLRRWLDLPAYWLLLLPVDLPAAYAAGVAGLAAAAVAARRGAAREGGGRLVGVLGLLALASFAASWLLVSTIWSNDLGWRALLPGILVTTAAAAAALSRWLAGHRLALAGGALALAALGVPDGLRVASSNLAGRPTPAAAAFARTPELWEAVRRHSAPADRVANNPLFLADLTPWPINASWAYLADRRSCYASFALALPFTPLPAARLAELEALFVRVFAGDGSADEVRDLADRYHCRLVVVTPSDGAWERDPFAASPSYRLVDSEPGRWRLYEATRGPDSDPK
jgi:hypothetical protein